MLLARFASEGALELRKPGWLDVRLKRTDPAYRRVVMAVGHHASLLESPEDCPPLIPLHEKPQPDDYTCWDVLAKAIGKLRGVGPDTLEEWKTALGSNRAHATFPSVFAQYLGSLGLAIQTRHGMTVDDLRRHWRNGEVVVCPIQEYGPETKAQPYGHAVAVVGFAGREIVMVFDPSIDNALEHQQTVQASGLMPIHVSTWDEVWWELHNGKLYDHFGIVVGGKLPGAVTESRQPTDLREDKTSFGSGFTGTIKDSLGRNMKFVDGKHVKGTTQDPQQTVHAKVGGQEVHVVSYDPENDLVKVQGTDGQERVVKSSEINKINPASKEAHEEAERYMDERMAMLDKAVEEAVKAGETVKGGASSWDDLDEDTQDTVRDNFVEENEDSFYEQELESWRKGLHDQVVEEVRADHEWENTTFKEWAIEQVFTRESAEAALEGHTYFKGPMGPEFSVLRYENDDIPNAQDQAVLQKLWETHYLNTQSDEIESREKEKSEDPPDDLRDAAVDSAEKAWDNWSDDEKFEFAKQSIEIETGKPVTVPDEWKVFHDGEDYEHTSTVALYLQTRRAEQLIAERLSGHPEWKGLKVNVEKLSSDVWNEWKGSSTSDMGLALQDATAAELNGRLRMNSVQEASAEHIYGQVFRAAGGHDDSGSGFQRYAAGKAIMQAYVRATWEASQYVLRKAQIEQVTTWRGLMLDKHLIESEGQETPVSLVRKREVGETARLNTYPETFTKLPGINLQRNGCASATTAASVANSWSGVGKTPQDAVRVVLRIKSPRTAVLSAPCFGQNDADEQETVLAGTTWNEWDAWLDEAPQEGYEEAERVTHESKEPERKGIDIDLFEIDQAAGKHWLSRVRQRIKRRKLKAAKKPKHIQEGAEPLLEAAAVQAQPGFTGEITDKLGRKRKFVNGKPVKGADDAKSDSHPSAKLHGQEVHVVARDSKHGLLRVKTPAGDKVVRADEIEFGDAKTQTPAQAAHKQNQRQQRKHGEPTEAEPATVQADGIVQKYKAKLTEAIDKVPGGNWLRTKAAQLNDKLKERYGEQATKKILASAVTISWGAFIAGPFVGYPNYIPVSVAMLPAVALAELHYQLSGKKKDTTLKESAEPEALTQEQIDELAKRLVDELNEAWTQRQNGI